jgi:hypothetical protein
MPKLICERFKVDREFMRIFGVKFTRFWSPLLSYYENRLIIDIYAFDAFLGVPDNQSLKDYATEKYGQEAIDLILELI